MSKVFLTHAEHITIALAYLEQVEVGVPQDPQDLQEQQDHQLLCQGLKTKVEKKFNNARTTL